jgi:transposase
MPEMEMQMPAGRPTKYLPEMCERVVEFGKLGMSKCEMEAELEIAHDTFNRWQKEIPEFSDAVRQAVRHSQAWWERKGREATFGGVDGYNATSYIFQMKNRFREDWNDTVKNEHSGPNGGPIVQKIERVIIDPKEPE